MLPVLRQMHWVRIAILGVCCVALSGPVRAQVSQVPDFSNDLVQRALEARQAQQQLQLQQGDQNRPAAQIFQPAPFNRAPLEPPSRLETLYSDRAARPLSQFGYNVLGFPSAVSTPQFGAVQDNYFLGEGDEIVVILRGQENATYRQRVNRDGQVILPKLSPVPAAGRSFGDFRADLERQVAQAYISTNVFVSLDQVRQIAILVTGEVRVPGQRILSAFATPVDAILLSGGVMKTGSLRNVSLVRGNQTINIDLYSVLMQGNLPNIGGLRNGDRIYVAPLQNTIAVSGAVRRPGIYELRAGQNAVDVNALIQLAGGIEIPGNYRYSTTHLEADGTRRLMPVARNASVASGELLFVDATSDVALERVTLAGAIRLAGAYPRSVASSAARLLRSIDDLTLDAYTPFAVIVRRDPRLNVRVLQPFSLVKVLSGNSDINLQNDDLVYVFNRDEVRVLAEAATKVPSRSLGPQAQANPFQNGIGSGNGQSTGPGFPGTNGLGAAGNGAGPNGAQPNQGPVNLQNPQNFQNLPSNLTSSNSTPSIPGFAAPNTPSAIGPLGTPDANANPDLRLQAAQQQVTTAGVAVSQAAQLNQQNALTSQSLVTGNTQLQQLSVDSISSRLGVPVQALVRLAADHLVWVLEQVRDPGAYVASEGTTLADMIQTAGGVSRAADLSSVEVTSTQIDPLLGTSRTLRTNYKGQQGDFQKVTLEPLDVIRLRPVFSDRENGQVSVLGQVRYPGAFDITRGERLSSLLERSGGLTDQAYPYGAVFTRERAALAEREGNIRQGRAIDAQLATVASLRTDTGNNGDRLAFLNTLAQQVRNEPVLGRITVTSDLAVLRVRPELDIVLEPGDTLYIPPRPSTVTVSGEVLNAGSFQYQAGLQVRDYLTLAGGITQGADSDRIFVILPDGTAHAAEESWLTFGNTNFIPPGSTIVVPRDLRPLDLNQFLRDAVQITSQLAVAGASIAVIGR